MSAIDRAFIKAYSDEGAAQPQRPTAPACHATENPTMNTGIAENQLAAEEAPRKTAKRTKRSTAAAAIRAAEPVSGVSPKPNQPVIDPALSHSPAAVATNVSVNTPKMVVGRRALKQLADSETVPAPHAAFALNRQPMPEPVARQVAVETVRASAGAGALGGVRSTGRAPLAESRSSGATHTPTNQPATQQFRVDPAVAATASPRMSNSMQRSMTIPAPAIATRSPAAAPRPAEVLPLSTYIAAEDSSAPAAVLEVDRLEWPEICETLMDCAAAELESVAARLAEHVGAGSQTIAVVSIDDGVGCTTVVFCLARMLAARAMQLCLVDGNCRRPRVAECLGLEPERGLEGVLAGEASLDDVLIESLEDRLALLPLSKPLDAEAIERSKLRQTVTFGELRERFDVVLVDAGCIGLPKTRRSTILEAGSIDAAILVGAHSADSVAWLRARRALEQCGVPCWGAIENRCAQ